MFRNASIAKLVVETAAPSNSRGRDVIRLLRDFDDTLLTTHHSEMLNKEDIRLRKLAEQTVQSLVYGGQNAPTQ